MENRAQSPEDKFLFDTGHIKSITHPKVDFLVYNGLDIEVQFTQKLKKLNFLPEDAHLFIKAFCGYMKAPVIVDSFADDKARNIIEYDIKELSPKTFYHYQSNRLRTSNIRRVLQFYDIFYKKTGIRKIHLLESSKRGVLDEVCEFQKGDNRYEFKNMRKYENWDLEKKIAVTDKVADFAREFCIYVLKLTK